MTEQPQETTAAERLGDRGEFAEEVRAQADEHDGQPLSEDATTDGADAAGGEPA
jgi:hypothetical protein